MSNSRVGQILGLGISKNLVYTTFKMKHIFHDGAHPSPGGGEEFTDTDLLVSSGEREL